MAVPLLTDGALRNRTHPKGGTVTDPRYWATSGGYRFGAVFDADLFAALSSTNDGLDGYGWTFPSGSFVAGAAGDFLSAADDDPNRLGMHFSSPRIFGSYDHMLMAARFLGFMPTRLVLEWYGQFSVVSANDTAAFLGFGAPGGTDATAGPGGIVSDSANFRLRSVTGNDAGVAVSTTWHLFRIVLDKAANTTEWFIDDISQGTITLDTDVFPTAVIGHFGTTNLPWVSWLEVWYE